MSDVTPAPKYMEEKGRQVGVLIYKPTFQGESAVLCGEIGERFPGSS